MVGLWRLRLQNRLFICILCCGYALSLCLHLYPEQNLVSRTTTGLDVVVSESEV